MDIVGIQDSKPKLSRRDFIKSAGILAGAVAASPWIDLYTPYKRPDLYPTPPSIKNLDEEDWGDERIRIKSQEIALKFEKFEAIMLLSGSSYIDENQKNYLFQRYNLNPDDVSRVEPLLHKNDGVSISDIGTIARAVYIKDGILPDEFKDLDKTNGDDYRPFLQFYSRILEPDNWKKYIESGSYEHSLLTLGTKGRKALLNCGFDLTQPEFQASLLKQTEATKMLESKGAAFIGQVEDPDNCYVVINSNDGPNIYQLIPELAVHNAQLSKFIVTHVDTIAKAKDEDIKLLNKKEFEVFQSWVYEHYVQVVAEESELNTEKFYRERLFQQSGLDINPINKVPMRMNQIVNSLVKKLSTGSLDYQSKENEARQLVISAAEGNLESFNRMSDLLSPGDRSIFHTRGSRKVEPRSYQSILRKISESDYSRDSVLSTLNEYSGNLFLVPLVDKISYIGEIKENQIQTISNLPEEKLRQLFADEISLPEYVSGVFGPRKVIVCDENFKPKGQIIVEKICELTPSVPEHVTEMLKAVEGEPWFSGREYLQKFVGRNLRAIVSDKPNSGGSDPTMQLLKQIAPSAFDHGTFGESNGSLLHRPDKYGLAYLRKLYFAVLNETAVDELYELNPNNSVSVDLNNKISQICAKLENYILARDFRNKFGEKQMIDLYSQYVPIGNTRGGLSETEGFEGGLQMFGLEAGSQYYFSKNLSDLNVGEISILIGMIQGPIKYSPQWSDGKKWYVNTTDTIDRALTVARLCREKGLFTNVDIESQIRNAVFTLKSPNRWKSDKPTIFKDGTFLNNITYLGGGLATIREPLDMEIPRITTNPVSIENIVNNETIRLENGLISLLNKEQLRLETREDSPVTQILSSFWNEISQLQFELQLGKIERKDFKERMNSWCRKNNINPDNHPDIVAHIDRFSQAKIYQCGQSALLANYILKVKFSIPVVPTSGIEGGVKNWVKSLGDNKFVVQNGYLIQNVDDLVNEKVGYDGAEMDERDVASKFEVGDMIVSWRNMSAQDYEDPGHVCTVIDKGKDSRGRTYIKIADTNYNQTGNVRVQILWSNSIGKFIFPGQRVHSAIIRPIGNNGETKRTNSNAKNYVNALPRGRQVLANDNIFGDRVLFATVDGKDVSLPSATVSVIDSDNSLKKTVVPGIAISIFDENGYVASVDKTGLLESLPVNPGTGLRPFIYLYLRNIGFINNQDTERVGYAPSQVAIGNNDTLVTNTSTLMMNLSTESYPINWRQALASGFDVPFQASMKKILDEDPAHWLKFQNFLRQFGVELYDQKGNFLTTPPPLAALGRDSYVANISRLGYALSVVANPEVHFGSDVEMVTELENVRDILLDDIGPKQTNLRNNVNIRGINPTDSEIGHSRFAPNVLNGVTTFTEINGDNNILWSGTYLGVESLSYLFIKEDGNKYKVVVARVRGGDLRQGAKISPLDNLSFQIATSAGAGGVGFPAIVTELSTN